MEAKLSWTKGAKHKAKTRCVFNQWEWALPLYFGWGLNFIQFKFLCIDIDIGWFDYVT